MLQEQGNSCCRVCTCYAETRHIRALPPLCTTIHNCPIIPTADPLCPPSVLPLSSLCPCCLLLCRPQVRIVEHAFDIIHLLTDQNPIQIVVDAIINRCAALRQSKGLQDN
jgi:hypothetical protein